MSNVQTIEIDKIDAANRIRKAKKETFMPLAESLREIGLLNPVSVSIKPGYNAGFMLVTGLHRLEAAKLLGWKEIDANVVEFSGPQAIIAECDENLCGTNLTVAERALFTAKRKAAYEQLHPETKAGVNQHTRKGKKDAGEEIAQRFTKETAERTGQSERTVQVDAARGEKIDTEVLQDVQGTDLDKGVILDEIAKAPKNEQKAKVEQIKTERKAKAEAPKEPKAKPVSTPDDDKTEEERIARWLSLNIDDDILQNLGQKLTKVCPALSRACMKFTGLNPQK